MEPALGALSLTAVTVFIDLSLLHFRRRFRLVSVILSQVKVAHDVPNNYINFHTCPLTSVQWHH